MYINTSIRHTIWNSPIIPAIKCFEPFHTRASQESGYAIASAEYDICDTCNRRDLYVIKSYRTAMCKYCTHCKKMYYSDVDFYSRMTRNTQYIIAEAIPDYHKVLYEYLDRVKRARRWLTPKRRQEYVRYSGNVDESEVLRLYDQYYVGREDAKIMSATKLANMYSSGV